jgi:FecR protein/Putative zinc-finger/Protein of unknown function (DUF3352)
MNRSQGNPEEMLDRVIKGISDEAIDERAVQEAGRRVWDRIANQAPTSGRFAGCADFQALIPAYRDGTLPAGRRMLFEDHMHGCVTCRRQVFGEPARTPSVIEMPARRMTRTRWMAIAASVTIAAFAGKIGYEQFGPAPAGPRATVQAANGSVYRVADGRLEPVSAGAEFSEKELLRTAVGSEAVVRLVDGSTVEVGERAEFRVSFRRGNTTVHLNRGPIIVQAAKRRSGHLYVASSDSRVSVTGTVFSVNRGAKGTRVSVVEGEVIVEHGRDDKVLHAGDQLATHSSMKPVAIKDEIAWSKNVEDHLKTLSQMVAIKESLENVRLPGTRYSSRFLDAVPANAVVFLSIPNMRDSLEDAQRLFTSEMRRNGSDASDTKIADFMGRIGQFSEYLGEEMAIAGVRSGTEMTAVAIAEVHRPGLADFLRAEMAKAGETKVQVVEGDQPIRSRQKDELLVAIRGDRVALGVDETLVNSAFGGSTGFAATAFGQRIDQAFREGTSILLGVDLHSVIAKEATKPAEQTVVNRLGVDGLRYLIAEQEAFRGKMQHSALLNFDGPRHGIASWLGAPGPMAGLSFVSSSAQFAASVITKDPRLMIEELFALAQSGDGKALAELQKLEQTAGVDLRQDIAASLGSEGTFAIDGPMLPVPSWKLIVEVNQPERLQQAVEKMVSAMNTELQKRGQRSVVLESEPGTDSTRTTLYRIRFTGQENAPEIHYVYSEGYLVAGSTRPLVQQALQSRASGLGLDRSDRFRRLLPTDQHANFSALMYQNATETLKFLANLAPDQQEQARELAGKIGPTLIGAYADADRIQVTSFGSSMDLLMQTAFAPMFHGGKSRVMQKHGTPGQAIAYRR